MSRIIIAGPKKVQGKVIRELHKLEILHIVEHSKDELADIGQPLENAGKLSEFIVKVRALIAALNIKKQETDFKLKRGLVEISGNVKKLNEEVNKNNEELRKAEELKSKSQSVLNELRILEKINLPINVFEPYNSLSVFKGYVPDSHDIEYLKDSLSKTTEKYEIFENSVGKKIFMVLFIDISNKDNANSVLQKIGFTPVNLVNLNSDMIDHKKNAAYSITKVEHKIQQLNHTIEQIINKNKKLAKEYSGFLITAEKILQTELEKAEAPLKFAATKDAFLVKGWVTTEHLDTAIKKLNKAGNDKIFIEHEPAKAEDKVPVKLKNSKYTKPFEFFINLYSTPTYKEIDPTFFIFLTFPIFFGFMLGDIGYGLVSFALFWFLKKKFPKAKNIFNVMLLASAVSVLFGFIYGEIFGLEEIFGFNLPHLLSRAHEVITLLYIAVGIGVIHVNIGLIIGFINKMRAHGLSKAIFEKGSWFVLQIGVALLALSSFNLINLPTLVGYGFLLIAVIMLFKGEGIKGIIELPSIFTNILSYARLMAIGLSSVSLALLINESAAGLFHKGGFSILMGILLLIVGHVFNIVLGLFGSFLHSLRLHYVEFFGKFFHGGAEKYKPFGAKE